MNHCPPWRIGAAAAPRRAAPHPRPRTRGPAASAIAAPRPQTLRPSLPPGHQNALAYVYSAGPAARSR
jgi:hypothetical protein